MKTIVKLLFSAFAVVFLSYLALPTSQFPAPPSDAVQSKEPADTENELRRAYFTNFTREEVLAHYQNQLNKSSFMNFPMITYRLNYPPEEAYTIIRDQTRSTFLEEVVRPFRESLYINGFEPRTEKDSIIIDGVNWRQKITVRYVPNPMISRIGVGILILSAAMVIYKAILETISSLLQVLPKK